ncbi:MAG: ABC transporter ATP-binding protein [Zestosphaera sp.]
MFVKSGVVVEVKDLVKIYKYRGGEVQALRGVTATFTPGTLTCVMGPSGSGKTTLLNLIGGIDVPTGGQVSVGSVRVHELKGVELDKYRLMNVGFVFQALNLIPTLTALENVMLPAQMAGVGRTESSRRALDLLRLVDLTDKASRYPEELSGGEQQRVAIAIALANDPSIIIADEPTAELDSQNARNVVEVLVKLAKQYSKTVILATHDPRVAVNTDRILRLEDGRLVGEVKPIDLERSAGVGVVEARERAVTLSELIKIKIASVEKELNEVEEKFKKSEIDIDTFHERVTKLKLMKEALTELLTSIGSS